MIANIPGCLSYTVDSFSYSAAHRNYPMCHTPAGGAPGRVAEVDANLNLIAEHPRSDNNMEGFNPHGLAIASSADRFITLDYAEYRTTFKPSTYIK